MRIVLAAVLVLVALLAGGCDLGTAPTPPEGVDSRSETAGLTSVRVERLPLEARETLQLIRAGARFADEKDGAIFNNFEHRLPERPRGYWKEYTVPTPGAGDRGARRIVAGSGADAYYTDDHYATFRRIDE